jgi:hypothetical protein
MASGGAGDGAIRTSFEAEGSFEARDETGDYNAEDIGGPHRSKRLKSKLDICEEELNKNIGNEGEYQTSIVIQIEFYIILV